MRKIFLFGILCSVAFGQRVKEEEVPLHAFVHPRYVEVEGFWKERKGDSPLAYPINVKYTCWKTAQPHCQEISLVLNNMIKGLVMPDADVSEYEVTSWNNDRIVAKNDNDGICEVQHTLVITLLKFTNSDKNMRNASVTVTDVPTKLTGGLDNSCSALQTATYELHGGRNVIADK